MSAGHEGLRLGLLATATGLGFRHGIDWDHIAAITDLTAARDDPRAAMASASCYFLGHGFVVGALGAAAIVAGEHVPPGLDRVMEKIVGVTLLALGVYVLLSLARNGREFRMRSRWMLVFGGVRRVLRWTRARGKVSAASGHDPEVAHHGHVHATVAQSTEATSFWGKSGALTSIGVGGLHGVGAETPTQVLLIAAAATAGGIGPGMLLLGAFLLGLFLSNSVVGLTVALGFLGASRNFALYAAVSIATGIGGMVVGAVLLTGAQQLLPSLLAG